MERVTLASVDAIVRILVDAFEDDPGLSWVWPDREDRLTRLSHFFSAIVSGTISNGIVYKSSCNAAASLWRLPHRISPDHQEIEKVLPSLAAAFETGRERSQLMSATLKHHQPKHDDWWYLQFIGVRPNAQGKGLGKEAICAGIDLARSAGMPIYVEVMNPANIGYYHHAGFETVGEFDIADDGPHVWAMMNHPPLGAGKST